MPVIVAESLRQVADPLLSVLEPAGPAPIAQVLDRMAKSIARPADPRPLPGWLRADQREVLARLLPILSRYHGALLADPAGSGKTWIALAAAEAWSPGPPATVLAPAAILAQWEATARSAGVPVTLWSHERASRGRLPASLTDRGARGRSLVVIDESHHFRNPGTRRYAHVAPVLMGRTVLMLSATPLVNRLADLAAQLHLGIRDDALAPFGVGSLAHHLQTAKQASPAIGEVVLTRLEPVVGKPARIDRREKLIECGTHLESLCGEIEKLSLSTSSTIAALVRSVFWRALASSPLALLATLRRYRSLLHHARDAGAAGKWLDRSSLRAFVGDDEEQMVLWELLPVSTTPGDIAVEDLTRLDGIIAGARALATVPDDKCRHLAGLLHDGRPTLVFVGARETVRYLRQHLVLPAIAWCTGEGAGIGSSRMPRSSVLPWFQPGDHDERGPRVLITTDVAAEGLDLQRAARVVHYDLPWTTVRLDQRDGRALRLGSWNTEVEVVRFDTAAPLERRLSQVGLLARKRRLPGRGGIDGAVQRLWTWRDRLVRQYGASGTPGENHPCWCAVGADVDGAIAGFSIHGLARNGDTTPIASVIGCLAPDGGWSEEPRQIDRWLALAVEGTPHPSAPRESLAVQLERLIPVIRERLDAAERRRWITAATSPALSRMAGRLNKLAYRAARARDAVRLRDLDRALAFVARGHTAGEQCWIERLLDAGDKELVGELSSCPPPDEPPSAVFARLTGIVILSTEY